MSKQIKITEEELNTLIRSSWNQGHLAGVMANEPRDVTFGQNKDQLFNENKDFMMGRLNDILKLPRDFNLEDYKR